MPDLTAPGEPIVLAGRSFRPAVAYTFANDLYVARELAASGVTEAFQAMASTPELDRARAKMVVAAFTSNRLCALLAGILHEDGVKWREAVAARNADFFAELTDPNDKAALLASLVERIAGFFLSGLASSTTSPNSSSDAGPVSDAQTQATSHRPDTAAPSTSDHGTASS
jgi:hypothetical protein